jgi:hypothetical protein
MWNRGLHADAYQPVSVIYGLPRVLRQVTAAVVRVVASLDRKCLGAED